MLVTRDLEMLAITWGDLVQSRIKGTARHWLASVRQRGWEQPNTEPAESVPNSAPAPLHLDVLDAIVEVVSWADTAAEELSQSLGLERLPHPSAYSDPRLYLDRLIEHLPALHAQAPDLAASIVTDAHHHAGRAARLMGLLTDGQVLDCTCPYCGAARTLTVIHADADEPVIVCMGSACRIEDNDRTGHLSWRHRRAWAYPSGWMMLARLLEDDL